MRRFLVLELFCSLLLPCGYSPPARAGEEFANSLAGLYFVRGQSDQLGQYLVFDTILPDGNALSSSSRDFGAGDPKANNLLSPAHHVSSPIGPREIEASGLMLACGQTGELVRLLKVDTQQESDSDFCGFSGVQTFHVFLVSVPPELRNPNGTPDATDTTLGEFSARRVSCADGGPICPPEPQGGGEAPRRDAGDVNCDGEMNLTDAVFLLRHLFQGGPAPLGCPGEKAELGDKVAGTYVYTAEAPGLPSFLLLATMTSNGSYLVSNTRQFGAGDLEGNGYLGLEHGAWTQVGPAELTGCGFAFGFDALGEHKRFLHMETELSFGNTFAEVTGPFNVDDFNADQDPLDDDPAQPSTVVGTLQARRLTLGAGDLNCDREVNLTDAVYLLQHLFQGGPPPVACPDAGDEVVGTYLYRAESEDPEALPPWLGILTVTRDRTYLASQSRQFGAGNLAENGYLSLEHGVWKPVGEREIVTRGLLFDYDPNGNLEGIEQFRWELSFAEAFDSLTGEFAVDHYGPDQDPTVVAPASPNVHRGTLAAIRLVP